MCSPGGAGHQSVGLVDCGERPEDKALVVLRKLHLVPCMRFLGPGRLCTRKEKLSVFIVSSREDCR